MAVLILVLVEDGLGVQNLKVWANTGKVSVLILVLVEDGLGVCGIPGHRESSLLVLILVLVEDGLGAIL